MKEATVIFNHLLMALPINAEVIDGTLRSFFYRPPFLTLSIFTCGQATNILKLLLNPSDSPISIDPHFALNPIPLGSLYHHINLSLPEMGIIQCLIILQSLDLCLFRFVIISSQASEVKCFCFHHLFQHNTRCTITSYVLLL